MAIESPFLVEHNNSCIPGFPQFTMETGGFGQGQVNNSYRTKNEAAANCNGLNNSFKNINHDSSSSIDPDSLTRRAGIRMEMQEASESSMSTIGVNGSGGISGRSHKKVQRRSLEPLDMFFQLKKQNEQHRGAGSFNSSISLSPSSSFARVHTIGSLANMGNMGSLSKLSASDMSLVLSSQGPASGKNNQSWGNLNNMNIMNERMHSSLPIMNSSFRMDNTNTLGRNTRNTSFGRMDTASNYNRHSLNNSHSMSNMGMGRNMGMNTNNIHSFGNQRLNNHQGRNSTSNDFVSPMMADDVGSSYFDAGNSFNNNSFRAESVFSGGYGGVTNESLENGGSAFNNNAPKDFSKLSNEQLRQMVMMDAIGNSVGPRTVSQHSVSTGSASRTVSKSNTNHSTNSNPFLKKLGLMNYRNHVMPLTLQQHSSKARRISRSFNGNENLGMGQTASDLASTATGHSSITTDFNMSNSNSNFSFFSDSQAQDDQDTMPSEKESYDAAANGILAPWSARAAGLFGDMMVQSTEDEKARKASRKKPKDRPKRPLSAYNIFFKEERNRILKKTSKDDADTDACVDGVPTTIDISEDFNGNTDQKDSADSVPSESRSSENLSEDGKSKKIGFESLAKLIGRRWHELDEVPMAVYKSKASVDMERYRREMDVWEAKHSIVPSRKRGRGNKKPKAPSSPTTDITSASAHETTSSSASSPVTDPMNEGRMPRRNSTGGSTDLSSSQQNSPKPAESPVGHKSFRDISKSRLGSELFELTEIEEDGNNGMV